MNVGRQGAGEVLWRPDAQAIKQSNMTRFAEQAASAAGRGFSSYEDLHRWSIEDPGAFWGEVWRFADIQASRRAQTAVLRPHRFPGAQWFPSAKLNYAENLLRFRDGRPALISYTETGLRRQLSYAELHRQSTAFAAHLAGLGIEAGDRVAGWLPNGIEAVVAMLATTTLGAVWSSCSPDFGVAGALDRFGQIEPKALIACDGYQYNGRAIDIRPKVREVLQRTGSIRHFIAVAAAGRQGDDEQARTMAAQLRRAEGRGGNRNWTAHRFAALLQGTGVPFAQLDFDQPLYILYSSGTTGKPKCIVHGVGGTLLQHAKEHLLHTGLSRSDKLFFFTTCGWMMWNWLVSALATGCTLLLYDGSPFHPGPRVLWDMAEREGVTVFGTSPAYLRGLAKAGFAPKQTHDLGALRTLLSTGSPLSDAGFRHAYATIKEDLHLASMTGGTDLISCFILGNPNLPVHAGELQCKGLGMAVDIWDDQGRSVAGRSGKGELVCTKPFPSAPIGFWRDEDGRKLHNAYFNRFPGVWAHGDFAQATANGGFIIHGRSDAVLNPGGVRIGSAEIYRQVETIAEVADAVCVGQQWKGEVRVVLFVVLRPDAALDAKLSKRIKQVIRQRASPRHVPAKIVAVPDIPRTLSGKIAELAVREAIHGRPVTNTAALANPQALEAYRGLAELNA